MSTIDRQILLQTLRGYAEVNKITLAEQKARLSTMTRAESWATFNSLYEAWQRTGQRTSGDQAALAQQHLEEKSALRRAFETLARFKGLL